MNTDRTIGAVHYCTGTVSLALWISSLVHFGCFVLELLVVALVLSRLDYCNSLLIYLPASLIQHLQSVQNAAARLIFNMR